MLIGAVGVEPSEMTDDPKKNGGTPVSKRLHLIGFWRSSRSPVSPTTWPGVAEGRHLHLTEDNEITLRYPIRKGGEVLTREVFETLMIHKVDRLNEIAEKWRQVDAHDGRWPLVHGQVRGGAVRRWEGLYDALIEQVSRLRSRPRVCGASPRPLGPASLNAAIWDPGRTL